LRLYQELLRNKHNEILLEIASAYTQAKKSNKQNRFPELHHPEDHQLVEFVDKFFVSINSNLRLYHELLRNKHNEILLEIASGVCQHTPKLKKSNKQNRFPGLHHPEDHQLVEFVEQFFVSINSTLRLYHELLRNKHN
jgi:hypothetical protein